MTKLKCHKTRESLNSFLRNRFKIKKLHKIIRIIVIKTASQENKTKKYRIFN